MSNTESSIAHDETIVSDSPLLAQMKESQESTRTSARRQIALIEGTGPAQTQETLSLLAKRLRLVSILLGAGFAAFLVKGLLFRFPQYLNDHPLVFYSHVGVTFLLALLAHRLCTNCHLVFDHLRIAELLIFGAPALFFMLISYDKLVTCAHLTDGHSHVPNIAGAWMLLIYSYALFVPNHWKRAAVVHLLMGAGPLLAFGLAYMNSEAFVDLIHMPMFMGVFSEHAMVMTLTVVVATVGVQTIGALRREAFVARQLGQYRLKKMLGSGGMGEVYLAEHEMMKRPCAVKVIRPEKAGNAQVIARFEREVRATAKLSHWNSIDIYDYGRTEDGTFYYVMEFLPGHNLGELVDGHGALPTERIVHLMTQVCDALAEAHEQDLVHRDIKPANIYCAYRGGQFDVAKLLDFGLAKPTADHEDVGLTQEGAITGSPLFMSPEQAMGSNEVDARSDIYSLGAVMYYMATGKPPFMYEQPIKVMVAHASEAPRPPRDLNEDIPIELEEIILRCLEKEQEDRFQDVQSMREALEKVPQYGQWSSRMAADWWHEFGCPQRKAMAAEALELAAV